MYLLINLSVDTKTRKWLNSYAVKVSRNAWINSAPVEGTTFIAVNYKGTRHMQAEIKKHAVVYLNKIHDLLMQDRVPSKPRHLIASKLSLISKVSHCQEVIGRADDLFCIISAEKNNSKSEEQSTVPPLIEEDNVQSYLLGLVKSGTIH